MAERLSDEFVSLTEQSSFVGMEPHEWDEAFIVNEETGKTGEWDDNGEPLFFRKLVEFVETKDPIHLRHSRYLFTHRIQAKANDKGTFKDSLGEECKGTLLIYCSRKKELTEMVGWLLKEGSIDPCEPTQDEWRTTPLMFAAANGLFDSTQMLLNDERVDKMALDGHGDSALVYAVDHNHVHIVELMKESGIPIDTIFYRHMRESDPSSGHGILHICSARTDCIDMMRWILEEGTIHPNLSSDDEDNITSLMVAAQYGNAKGVSLLLDDPRVDGHALDSRGRSALLKAARNNHVSVVSILKQRGFDLVKFAESVIN